MFLSRYFVLLSRNFELICRNFEDESQNSKFDIRNSGLISRYFKDASQNFDCLIRNSELIISCGTRSYVHKNECAHQLHYIAGFRVFRLVLIFT